MTNTRNEKQINDAFHTKKGENGGNGKKRLAKAVGFSILKQYFPKAQKQFRQIQHTGTANQGVYCKWKTTEVNGVLTLVS